jgi:hypothetical protein
MIAILATTKKWKGKKETFRLPQMNLLWTNQLFLFIPLKKEIMKQTMLVGLVVAKKNVIWKF